MESTESVRNKSFDLSSIHKRTLKEASQIDRRFPGRVLVKSEMRVWPCRFDSHQWVSSGRIIFMTRNDPDGHWEIRNYGIVQYYFQIQFHLIRNVQKKQTPGGPRDFNILITVFGTGREEEWGPVQSI